MKISKTKLHTYVTIVVLVLMSLSCLGSCGIFDISKPTTSSALKTTVPNALDFSNTENTFETLVTTIGTESGETITITHGKDFNEDDIEFLLTLHGKTRNDGEMCEPLMSYNLKMILDAGKNGNPILLAHFENPYFISAYLKADASEYELNEWGDYKFDITKYVWYKFYNSEQLTDEIDGMKRTEDTYLFYDCTIKRDIVNGIEYNKNCKYYMEYKSEYNLKITTSNMLLYFESQIVDKVVGEKKYIHYPEFGGGVLDVYVDGNDVEYLYFYYGSYYEDGSEYENYTQKRFGEHYEYLSQYFEILNEHINDSGRTVKSAGIKLDTITKYLIDGR